MLSVETARARILDGVEPTPAEPVALADAVGRTLARDLAATLTQPPFDASAMDGYAVRAADLQNLPATLTRIGEARAGAAYEGAIRAGECVRIFTGAPVPAGADAIVIQENTKTDGERITVVEGTPDPAHIRPRGGDFADGEVLLKTGRRLDARAIMLAAAMGHGVVKVRRMPVVAVLATGDELVEPGTRPGPDQIISSNPFGLAALIRAAGAMPRLLGIAGDTQAALAEKIDEARGADILVTTGGASVGDHDLVAPALQDRGMSLDFWKIAMRPGKPMLFGRLGSERVLGLPGNPVSALICGRVFLVPLIEAMLGRAEPAAETIRARLAAPLEQNGPRQHYMRAEMSVTDAGTRRVIPHLSQDSSLMAPLAAANALIVRKPGAAAEPAGAEVDVLAMDF